jgi:hypothetical protein
MQITDHRRLGPGFERQLKAALDSIVPRTPNFANARYRSAGWARSSRPWRLAPALIGTGAILLMAVSAAAAATGSPNPAVWTQRATSTIQSISHIPENSPNPPQQNPAPEPRGAAPVIQPTGSNHNPPTSGRQAEPTEKPQPSEKPEDSPRPEGPPWHDHFEQPSPSPTPSDPHSHDSNPSPPPDDHGGEPHGH